MQDTKSWKNSDLYRLHCEEDLKGPFLIFRMTPGSGFSSDNINYQLLQFAAAGAALRTSRAIIGPNLIEYISDGLFQRSKDNKKKTPQKGVLHNYLIRQKYCL